MLPWKSPELRFGACSARNALGRGLGLPRLKVDGRLGGKTVAALARFLAAREREGEEALIRALRALD